MPQLINNVLSSLPKLGDVALLCAFIFLVFGIVGVQLFKGRMHYRCALPGFNDSVVVDTNGDAKTCPKYP